MPRLNARGDWCAGTTLASAWGPVVDGTCVPVDRFTNLGPISWLTDDTLVGQGKMASGMWHVQGVDLAAPTVQFDLSALGANRLVAGGGVWAAQLGTTVRWGTRTQTLASRPNAGPVDVSRDGLILIKPDYATGIGFAVIVGTDVGLLSTRTLSADACAVDGMVDACWSTPSGIFREGRGNLGVAHATVKPRLLGVDGAPWLLYQFAGHLVLHPQGDPEHGIVVADHSTYFRPDLCRLPSGLVRVVWAADEGESVAGLGVRDLDLAHEPRVDLTALVPPEPPVPHPLPPKATITSFQTPVHQHEVSLAVAQVTQGQPAYFQWQFLDGTWVNANTTLNPATDLDHHFPHGPGSTWPHPGNFDIRLQTLDADKHLVDQTSQPRTIVVLGAPQPQPPDPTPQPPQPMPTPPPGTIAGRLQVGADGRFHDDHGLATVYAISEFDLLYLSRTGLQGQMLDRFRAAQQHGRTMVRVFGSAKNLFDLNPDQPGYDDALTFLIAGARNVGVRILLTIFCDAQLIYPDPANRTRVLRHLLDRFGTEPAILWQIANEPFKNGWSSATDPALLDLAVLAAAILGHKDFLIGDPQDGDDPDASAATVAAQKTLAKYTNILNLHPSRKGGGAPSDGHYRRWVNHLEGSGDAGMITQVRHDAGRNNLLLFLDEPIKHASACGGTECEADAALAGAMTAAITNQPYCYHHIASQDPATPGLNLLQQYVPLVPLNGAYFNDSWQGSPSHGFTGWDKVRWSVLGTVGIGVANGLTKGTITYSPGWKLDQTLYDGPHCQVIRAVRA